MPIVARCPFCRKGKVHAPDRALGQSATCPKCQSCFTIAQTEPTGPIPTSPFAPRLDDRPPSKEQVKISEKEPPATAIVEKPLPRPTIPEGLTPIKPPPAALAFIAESARPDPEPENDEPEDETPSIDVEAPVEANERLGLPVALVSAAFGGIALMASQSPLEHIGTFGIAAIGLALAFVALGFSQKRLVPWLATAFNFLIILFVMVLPGWLNLRPWQVEPSPDLSDVVLAFGHDGAATLAPEWVDTHSFSWQRDTVRVSVGRVVVGPVELKGPNDQKRITRDRFVMIRLRVKNVGVFGSLVCEGWNVGQARLFDSTGRELARQVFDEGWEPSGRTMRASAGPSKSIEYVLFFAAPATTQYFRLELDGAPIGSPVPVKLQIPWLQIEFPTSR